MAELVAVLGRKGGCGKATLAHALAHGLGSLPRPIDTVVITTDPDCRPPAEGRRYLPLDGRDPAEAVRLLERLVTRERLVVVFDGAARRGDADAAAAHIANLVLLPMGPSIQDLRVALADLERLPRAVVLPNRWPTHPLVRERARRLLEAIRPSAGCRW